jgi:SAM-dependent methyltransferase
MPTDLRDSLRLAYDRAADQRDADTVPDWKIAERDRFLAALRAEQKTRLLEIGAGPGHHGRFFQDNGLQVVCTDLSPEMVERCRAKGLEAYVMGFAHPDFAPASFDAIFALNCLLHLPSAELPATLSALRDLLAPGGLMYYGVYGGRSFEGVWPDDTYDPPRYFTFYSDEALRAAVAFAFEIVSFAAVDIGQSKNDHFQSLILRRP